MRGPATSYSRSSGTTASETGQIVCGPSVKVDQGTARSYVLLDGGTPTGVAFALSQRSFDGLPAADPDGGPHTVMHAYLLTLPAEADATAYEFLELDWKPMGHEPDNIHTVPHFDFHFYTASLQERNAIVPAGEQYATRAGKFPTGECAPQGYLPASTLAGAPPEAAMRESRPR